MTFLHLLHYYFIDMLIHDVFLCQVFLQVTTIYTIKGIFGYKYCLKLVSQEDINKSKIYRLKISKCINQ